MDTIAAGNTLDGMTVAQLDDIIARAIATKAAVVKAAEDKNWREFTMGPEWGNVEYRIHVQTREVQRKVVSQWIKAYAFSDMMNAIGFSPTPKKHIVAALTALIDAECR